MRKLTRKTCRIAGALVLALAGAALALDLLWETAGVPQTFVDAVLDRRTPDGVEAAVGRVRCGLFGGVRATDLYVTFTRGESRVILQSERCRLDLARGALLRGDMRLNGLDLRHGTMRVLALDGDETVEILQLSDVDVELRRQAADRAVLHLSSVAQGVRVEARLRLLGAPQRAPRGATQHREHTSPLVPAEITRLANWLHETGFDGYDAHVRVRGNIDLAHPRASALEGTIGMDDIFLAGFSARRLRASVAWRAGALNVRRLQLTLSRDEYITGNVVLDLDRRQLSGRLEGAVREPSLRPLLAERGIRWPAALACPDPVRFGVNVAPSGWRLEELTATGRVATPRLSWHELALADLDLDLAVADGAVRLASGSVAAEGAPDETLTLNGTLWWPQRELTAELVLRADLAERVHQAGIRVPEGLRRFRGDNGLPRLALQLDRSPLDWRRWTGRGDLRWESFDDGLLRIDRLKAALACDEGRLSLDELEVAFQGEQSGTLRGSASLDTTTLPADNAVTLMLDATVDGTRNPGDADLPARGLRGTLTFAPETKTLQGQCSGTLYPERVYRALKGPLHLPHVPALDLLSCDGPAPSVTLELPPCPLTFRGWKIRGTLEGRDIRFDNTDLASIKTNFDIDGTRAAFADTRIATCDGSTGTVSLTVTYDPLRVHLTEGTVVGDPAFVEAFIPARNAKEIYRAVWRDFRWQPESPPRIKLESLLYRQGVQRNDWTLKMASHLSVDGASYRDLETEHLDLDVILGLPHRLQVRNVRIDLGSAVLGGDVHIEMEGTPTCEFELKHQQGGVDPRTILHVINPDWDPYLDGFDFDPASQVNCRGAFFISREPRLHLAGDLNTPSCSFHDLDMRDVTATWRLNGQRIGWDIVQASLHNGELQGTGLFDLADQAGQIALRLDAADLDPLLRRLGMDDDKPEVTGKLSGDCRLHLLRGWGGRRIQLAGNGKLRLHDADLWRVPVFTQLAQLLDVTMLSRISKGRISSLGRISELDAELDFRGARVVVPRIQTDGTLMALNGEGEYSWETQRLRFALTGQTLKKVSLVSIVLRPLSLVFNAELTGTLDDHQWHMVSTLRKAISGTDERTTTDPVDETPE